MGFEDCGKDLDFILNETGNHRKVLGREGYLKVILAVVKGMFWMFWDGGKG